MIILGEPWSQLEGKRHFLLPFLMTWKKGGASTAAKASSESDFIIPVSRGTLALWCPYKILQNETPSYPPGPFSQGSPPPPPPPHTCPKHVLSCQAVVLRPCSSLHMLIHSGAGVRGVHSTPSLTQPAPSLLLRSILQVCLCKGERLVTVLHA